MDIFNGNRKLEAAVMFALDWGVYLRHDLDEPIAPFMYLLNGDEKRVRVLMTEGDPIEYAARVLAQEKEPFQQFVIGIEGYLRDENNERIDAIIVQGFDKTQAKGVILGQMFSPMEKGGTFRKIERAAFLGNPDLPMAREKMEAPDYTGEGVGVNAMGMKYGDLTQYAAFFTHSNPSLIVDMMKRFLHAKVTDERADSFSGRIELVITPGVVKNGDFLKFVVLNAMVEERQAPPALSWEQRTGRKLRINVKHGEVGLLNEFELEDDGEPEAPKSEENATEGGKYAAFSVTQLEMEFNRIIAIPNARTNITALEDMTELMAEYKRRGLALPEVSAEGKPKPQPKAKSKGKGKPWWKFW
ncbi:MAG: hypothetical protein AAF998_18990 [Bacteroidota bacterium]